jgi:hypothetical protein
MAASWITIAAPYVPEIIRLARPLFTRTPTTTDNTQQIRLDVVSAQIGELQNAASQNADSIRKLATDMQKTLEVLQLGSERMQKRLVAANLLAFAAITTAVLAFGVATYALAH